MSYLRIKFTPSLCSGCLACVVACRDQNDIDASESSYRTVTARESGSFPAVVTFSSTGCLNCRKSPCLAVCPTAAIFRHPEDNVVDVNRRECIGCRSCESVCPVQAPKFLQDGKMAKCDLCRTRVRHGLLPACVHTCPTGALQVDDH